MRFPDFEAEWEIKPLNELCELKGRIGYRGYTVNDIVDVGEGALAFNPSNINSTGAIEYKNNTYISWFKYEESPEIMVENGHILLVKTGSTFGKVALVENLKEKATVNPQIVVIKPKRADNKFLSLVMLNDNFQKLIHETVVGGAIPTISQELILRFLITLPSIPEQQKIASFFTAIDQKISHLKRKKKLLEQYKKGVMQKIFTQEIRFKDDNGQEFPKWEKKKLGELTYKTGKKNKDSTPFPIYSINNREGFLPQGDQFEGVDSNSRGYDISLYKIIEEKTFAYNPARINVGSIGFSGDLKNIIISSLYVCFKTKQGLEDAYLLHYLKTFQFNKSVLQNVEGGVRDYLFYENFSNIKINLPSNKEQLKIANFLSAIDDKINHTQKQVEKAEVWKKGLMQQMFC